MCAIHARVIDHGPNEGQFPAETLREWKRSHERTALPVPTSDEIAYALLGRSTGVSLPDAAIIAADIQRRKVAAIIAGSTVGTPPEGPVTLRRKPDQKER